MFTRTFATAKSRFPRSSNKSSPIAKYEPLEYNPWLFKRYGILRQMDERERFLSSEYVRIMKSPAVVFFQDANSSVSEITSLRRQLRQKGVRWQFVNSKLFRGQLIDTKYEALVPVLNGRMAVAWCTPEIVKPINLAAEELPPLKESVMSDPLDTILFTRTLLSVTSKFNNKIFLMGAKIESHLLAPRAIEQFAKLPLKDELYSSLAQVLQSPAQQLVSSLQHHPQSIVSILHQHASSQPEEPSS